MTLDLLQENKRLQTALRWYAEQVEGCRKLGSIGEPFRNALDKDGGARARAALDGASGDAEKSLPGVKSK